MSVNPKKVWSKKSKSPVVMSKQDHTWILIMKGYQYCLECQALQECDETRDIIDLSSYFDYDMTKNYMQELVDRITIINSTFQFLKNRNPDANADELLQILVKHFQQMDNESNCYCLERKREIKAH